MKTVPSVWALSESPGAREQRALERLEEVAKRNAWAERLARMKTHQLIGERNVPRP